VTTYARLVLVWMTLLALAFAPAAEAAIQLDRGIAGARLGNSRADVRKALGTPTKTSQGTNDFGRWVSYRYPGKITVFFQGRERVSSVRTAGLGDRTAEGIGVGSTENELTRSVKGLECEDVGANLRTCHTGEFLPGRRVTDFRLSNGKVESVTVALVVD
jgi:hypothetical protein